MEIKNFTYIKLLLLHVLLGVLVFLIPVISQVTSILLFFIFIFIIIKNKNINNEALICSAYIVAIEVFFRMTNGAPNNEYGKYSVIIFLTLGMFFSGISKKSIIFWVFILFLIPGIFIGMSALKYDVNIRKAIAFNISGPVCLAISSIYTYQKKINKFDIEKIITWMIFPIIATVTYMFLYSPINKNIFTGTESNIATSGGFGPNQVSTILGLGMFLLFVRLILYSKDFFIILINSLLVIFVSYRAIITFSRGGVYTGVAMIILFLITVYFFVNVKDKIKINLILIVSSIVAIGIFTISSLSTGGLLYKRYAGEDALGREKASKFSGREKLVESELNMFLKNPITGIGVGVNKQYREETFGIEVATHNELTRMLAEHGLLGVLNLLILLLTPIILYLNNKQNIFIFSFFIFWLLTINHAAMRIAAPAFIYALSLLKFDFSDELKDVKTNYKYNSND